MTQINRIMSAAARLRQRGSALLVALMTLVGLSLLGLAFVAMSETESAISVNQRNHAQVVATSESGAREVVQWFQNPDAVLATTGGATRMMPDQSTAVATWAKTQRVVQAYTGYYKDSTTKKLCDLPFGPDDDDVLFGNESSADIIIDRTTSQGRDFLDNNFNPGLLGTGTDPRDTGEVTSIKVFAPPILGGSQVTDTASGHSFWVNGTRLGVATIAVKVDKYDKPRTDSSRRSIATATCRIVVGQFPLPTPAGPLQSQTALQTQGNFNVNWGIVASGSTLQLAKDYQTLPWVNAYELVHFERGYDSSVEFATGKTYYQWDIIRPTVAARTANSLLNAHEYIIQASGSCTSGTAEPAWTTSQGGTTNAFGGTCVFTERFPTAYPINTSLPQPEDSNHPWLFYVGTGSFNVQDPWFQARAVSAITGDPAGAQPYPFPYLSGTPATPISYGATHHFQNQSFNSYPNYRQVIFPTMDYNFWKATAIAANGVGGVHYVWPQGNVPTDTYTDGVNSGDLNYWTSNNNGFTFFDTVNQLNPQNGGPGSLNQAQNPGSSAWVEGFVYLNAPWNTRGQASGPIGWFNQPGEPYEDVGFRQVAESTNATQVGGNFVTDASGQAIIIDAYNNQWDYQDLAWSNSGNTCCSGTKNKHFDVYVRQRHVYNPGTAAWYDGYFVVPYFPGCHPGDNASLGNDSLACSEPHEPYLNIIYVGGHEPNLDNSNVLYLNMGWQDPNNQTRVAKKTNDGTASGTPLTCTASSSTDDCTSNAYDKRGGLVQLDPGPITTGVLYSEGLFGTTGNGVYYGAVLAGSGGIDPKGTPHVWYDSSLQDGSWLPPGLPRVLITSLQMDQN